MNTSTPPYYAFFDVDETIINTKSMFDFLKFYYCTLRRWGYIRYWFIRLFFKFLAKQKKPREQINALYYKLYKGASSQLIKQCGVKWFHFCMRNKQHFFNAKVLEELSRHKALGARIVLVSGSFDACLEPIAKYIGADVILAAKLEITAGKYSGKLLQPPVIGRGKAAAVKNLLDQEGYSDLAKCFAYGDHISDLPMLSLVGHPVVIAGNLDLTQFAKTKNWTVLPQLSSGAS